MALPASNLSSYRDVSSVEQLMNYHQGIKSDIDTRNESFATCIESGKKLLEGRHRSAAEVRVSTKC